VILDESRICAVKFAFDIRLSFKTEMTNLSYCETSEKR
jgi:hypothetical protein